MIANHYLKEFASKKKTMVFYFGSFLLLGFQVFQTKDAFFVYSVNQKPYAKPKYVGLFDPNKNYRILSLSPSRSADSLFAGSLTLNFATVQGLASADGYEPLFQNGYNLYTQHRQAGIRYFILGKYKAAGEYFTGMQHQLELFSDYKSFTRLYEDDQVTVLEDNAYEPILQVFDKEENPKPFSFTMEYQNNGANILLDRAVLANRLILGFNYHKNLTIYCNGIKRTFATDPWNRIAIELNDSLRNMEIRYHPFNYF
jgi:hypothetical protein